MIQNILSKNFIINSLLVFLIFLIDRISKIYVIHLDQKLLGSEIFSSKFLNINLIWNNGIAFGLLNFEKENLYNFLTVLILIIVIFIALMSINTKGFKKFSFLIILGGAIGNVFDRIFTKAVPDFIDFHIGNFHWFIFNIADIFITFGVIFLILLEITDNNKIKKL